MADSGRPKETSDHIHVSFCFYSSVWTILIIFYFINYFSFLFRAGAAVGAAATANAGGLVAAGGAALSAGAGAVASAASAFLSSVSGSGEGASSGAPTGGPRPPSSTKRKVMLAYICNFLCMRS